MFKHYSKTILLATCLLAATSSALGDEKCDQSKSNSPLSRDNFNLYCLHDNGEILINSYRFDIGIRLHTDSEEITPLETLLIEPNKDCADCYNVTAKIAGSASIYLFRMRLEKPTSVRVYEVLNKGYLFELIGKTTCTENI